MKKKTISVAIGIMCFILTATIIVQYKTVQNANSVVGINTKNSELKTEVLKWKEQYDNAYKELEKAEQQLEKQRKVATKNDESSLELQKELNTYNSLIGAIDVKGKGLIITIADNANATSENIGILDNISNYLIHDTDLIDLVNELKNAGAEAISINDERIINSTSITCDGNVIIINGQKVSSPFIIKAIGSAETMLGAIRRPGGYLKILEGYGLVSNIATQKNIVIYKYNGVIE